jgi:hypothetical protein
VRVRERGDVTIRVDLFLLRARDDTWIAFSMNPRAFSRSLRSSLYSATAIHGSGRRWFVLSRSCASRFRSPVEPRFRTSAA